VRTVGVRDLQRNMGAVRRQLAEERYLVLTASDRPFAILFSSHPDSIEDDLRAIRSARALEAMRRIQADAKARGLDKMTMEEINALIAKVRRERSKRKGR